MSQVQQEWYFADLFLNCFTLGLCFWQFGVSFQYKLSENWKGFLWNWLSPTTTCTHLVKGFTSSGEQLEWGTNVYEYSPWRIYLPTVPASLPSLASHGPVAGSETGSSFNQSWDCWLEQCCPSPRRAPYHSTMRLPHQQEQRVPSTRLGLSPANRGKRWTRST